MKPHGRALVALFDRPATAFQLAGRTGLGPNTVARIALPRLHRLGLAAPDAEDVWRLTGRGRAFAGVAVLGLGGGR